MCQALKANIPSPCHRSTLTFADSRDRIDSGPLHHPVELDELLPHLVCLGPGSLKNLHDALPRHSFSLPRLIVRENATASMWPEDAEDVRIIEICPIAPAVQSPILDGRSRSLFQRKDISPDFSEVRATSCLRAVAAGG